MNKLTKVKREQMYNRYYNILFLLVVFSFVFTKAISPEGDAKSKKINQYKYYELKEDGQDYSRLRDKLGLNEDDSVRVKVRLRAVKSKKGKGAKRFGAEIKVNESARSIEFAKNGSKIEHRSGWVYTESGIWFLDINLSSTDKFQILPIKSRSGKVSKVSKNIFVRVTAEKLRRKEKTKKILDTVNKESKYIINTKQRNKSKKTYWHFLGADSEINKNINELQYAVKGPTSIRVFTRLNNFNLGKEIENYILHIKEDGLDIGSYFFETSLSPISRVNKTGSTVGKWRSCWINVPSGIHYYTLRIEDTKNTSVFIRVKEYEK